MKYNLDILYNNLLRDYQRDIISPFLRGEKRHAFLILPRRTGKSVLAFYLVNSFLANQYRLYGRRGRVNAGIFAMQDNQVRNIYIDNILSNGHNLLEIAKPISNFRENLLELQYHFGNKKDDIISKIKFKGTNKLDSLMGGGYKILVLDEFALQKDGRQVFDRLYPMIQQTNGHIIIVSTVRGRNHMYELYNELIDNPEWLVVKKSAIELGILTQDEYDAIPMNDNLKRQEYLCDWDSSNENAIYESPKLGLPEYEHNNRIYISMDLGMADGTVIWYSQYYNNNVYLLKSETYINKSISYINTCIENTLKSFNGNNNFMIFLPHDSTHNEQVSGTNRFLVMRNHFRNVQVVKKSNDVLEDIDFVRAYWDNIIFHEYNCAREIEEIKKYTTKEDTYKIDHKHSHAPDALRYLIIGLRQYVDNRFFTNLIHYDRNYKFNRIVI